MLNNIKNPSAKTAHVVLALIYIVIMAAILLFLLGWHLFGNFPHEILGTGLFVLFSIHNILNFRWYRSLFRGRYTVFRAVQTAVILLLWLCIVLTAASSLMISRDVWAFLDVPGAAVGRKIHLVATAWLFVLSGVHLGFHARHVGGYPVYGKGDLVRGLLDFRPQTARSVLHDGCDAVRKHLDA